MNHQATLHARARQLERWFQRHPWNPLWRMRVLGSFFHPYWRLRLHSFGAGSILHRPVWLHGAHKIAIGKGTVIAMALLSAEAPAWSRSGPAISIGNRVAVRPFTTITAAESVVIEDDVGIGSHSLVTDLEHVPLASEKHVPSLSDLPINPIAGGTVESTPVRIGRGTAIFERVAVLRGSEIGQYCRIGANSVVKGRIPDYSVAVGAPARVVGSTRPPA